MIKLETVEAVERKRESYNLIKTNNKKNGVIAFICRKKRQSIY